MQKIPTLSRSYLKKLKLTSIAPVSTTIIKRVFSVFWNIYILFSLLELALHSFMRL